MIGYDYWTEHVIRFTKEFGAALEIDHCELTVSDYSQNYPQEIFSVIQMPTHYLVFLNLHANLILSNQNLFKDIGNFENEKLNKENFNVRNYLLDIKTFLETNKDFWDTFPNDERRNKYAGLLRDLMTYFTIYHEIGHIRQKNYPAQTIRQEIGVTENKEETKWAEQIEEVDADIFAIKFLWRTVFYNFHQFRPNSTLTSTKELLSLSLYSTFLFFYLSDNDEELNNPLKEHPHPIVRFSIVADDLQKIVELNELCNKQDFNKIVQSVLREFDSTLTYHFKSTDNKSYYDKFYSPEVAKVRSKLQTCISLDPSLNFNRPYTLSQ